jgi:hypothetical protein
MRLSADFNRGYKDQIEEEDFKLEEDDMLQDINNNNRQQQHNDTITDN